MFDIKMTVARDLKRVVSCMFLIHDSNSAKATHTFHSQKRFQYRCYCSEECLMLQSARFHLLVSLLESNIVGTSVGPRGLQILISNAYLKLCMASDRTNLSKLNHFTFIEIKFTPLIFPLTN